MVLVFEDFAIELLLFAIPLYVSNAVPVLIGGLTPIDFGKNFFDGKRLFGEGKTFRGFAIGVLSGWGVALLTQYFLLNFTNFPVPQTVFFGLFVAFGALFGDLVGSFVKRRIGIKRGAPVFLLDQLDFVAGGIIFGSVFYAPSFWGIIFIAGVTVILHRVTNYIAFKMKLKNVPW
ncbi:MAG: CDP-2,3-bis-(O-geranylgeranyl)-sn-glycerol synthase [Candidatus Diapherotrites archaeon]